MKQLAILLGFLLLPGSIWAYSYSAAGKEPLLDARKNILMALEEGDQPQALAELAKVNKEIAYLETHFVPALSQKLKTAITSGKQEQVLTILNQLFATEIKHRVLAAEANIKNYQVAKILLVKSKPFFDILAPHLPQVERKQLLQSLKGCLQAIGKPGVFGVGAVQPNADLYQQHRIALVKALETSNF